MDDTSCQQLLCPLCFMRVLEQIQRWLCPSSQSIFPHMVLKYAPGGAAGGEQAVGREQATCQEQSCSRFSQRNIPGCSPASPTSPSCKVCVCPAHESPAGITCREVPSWPSCASMVKDLLDATYRALQEQNGASIIYFPLSSGSEEQCQD